MTVYSPGPVCFGFHSHFPIAGAGDTRSRILTYPRASSVCPPSLVGWVNDYQQFISTEKPPRSHRALNSGGQVTYSVFGIVFM